MDASELLLRMEVVQGKLIAMHKRITLAEQKLKEALDENQNLKTKLKQLESNQKLELLAKEKLEKDFVKQDFFHKLAKNYSNGSVDNDDLRNILSKYISEIDECIALISS